MTDASRRSLLTIPERPLVWLSVGAILLAFVWSFFGELAVVSNAPGEVVPASYVKQVQHLEGGIVQEFHVQEGQVVRKDQPLVTLAPIRSQSEVDELRQRIVALQSDLIRLDAEIASADKPEFSDDMRQRYPSVVEKSEALFATRRQRHASDVAAQEQLLIQRKQAIAEVDAALSMNRELSSNIGEQIEISRQLLARDLTNRLQHLALVRQQIEINGKLQQDTATLARAVAAQREAAARLDLLRTSFEEDARKERDTAARSLAELSERVIKYEDSLQRTVLRAPVDGVVKTIYAEGAGGVIKPGTTVLDIVPTDDRLVIEARLPIQDIGYVRSGNGAQIRLASAAGSTFGHINGKVVRVSADAIVGADKVAFYKVRIETERAYFERGRERYQLYPGIQVQSAIQTGTRTVLDYVLAGLSRPLDQALHER